MPTYSYRCTQCNTAFDIHQEFTDSSLTVCPSCSGALRKLFSAVGVSFTGSGFYRNDSRADAGASKSSGGSKSTESASKEKKTESASTPAVSSGTGAGTASVSASASTAKSTSSTPSS